MSVFDTGCTDSELDRLRHDAAADDDDEEMNVGLDRTETRQVRRRLVDRCIFIAFP